MSTTDKVFQIANIIFWVSLVVFVLAMFANWDLVENSIKSSIENMESFRSVGEILNAIIILLKVIDIYDIILVILSGITMLGAIAKKRFTP